MIDHEAIIYLLPLAAIDWIELEEARALEEHLLEGCDRCEAEIRVYREASAVLAMSLGEAGSEERVWELLKARLHPPSAESS